MVVVAAAAVMIAVAMTEVDMMIGKCGLPQPNINEEGSNRYLTTRCPHRYAVATVVVVEVRCN